MQELSRHINILWILCFLASNIFFLYYVFLEQELYNRYASIADTTPIGYRFFHQRYIAKHGIEELRLMLGEWGGLDK